MTENTKAALNDSGRIDSGFIAAFPIMAAVFIFFSTVGMALPVLPLQVHNVLGFGPFVVGIVAGFQFVAALISRLWAGRISDGRGAKFAVRLGFFLAIAGGLFYLISLLFLSVPDLSVVSLLIGRTLLGGAESLVITGSMLWALQLVDENKSAKIIAWVGMSMFAAFAAGAPVGSYIFDRWGFAGISVASVLTPFAALFAVQNVYSCKPEPVKEKTGISKVLNAVFLPGVGFALSGITFGAVTTFLTLLFSVNKWDYGAIAFASFAAMLIVTRIFFGHLPDKFGGAKVSIYCLSLQVLGLVLIGTTSSGLIAIIGAAASGMGFSLVFPGLGLEVLKSVPAERRGIAIGSYNAFLDITLGFGSPALGLLAGEFGLKSVFIASAIAAGLAIIVTLCLLFRKKHAEKV